jgi:hypothetical protein
MSLCDVSKVRHALIVSVKQANTVLRPEDEGVFIFRNVGKYSPDDTTSLTEDFNL